MDMQAISILVHGGDVGSCSLHVPGTLDRLGNFVREDPSCPWVDYAWNVLTKADANLTDNDRQQKQRLVYRRPRNILLIGDSQERNMVENFCTGMPGATLTVVSARWTRPDGTVVTAPKGVRGDGNRVFRSCRLGQLTVASFFHFGFISGSKWADNHVSGDEPREIQDRIDNLLPTFLEDVFGKDAEVDAVVVHSGLWDLVAISFHDDWAEQLRTLNQLNSQWHVQANRVATSLEALLPTATIVWRNLPNVAQERSKRQVYGNQKMSPFTFEYVTLMNDVGVSFAQSRKWPVLDVRGPLLPMGPSELQADGFHFGYKGWKLFMNRILNAVVGNE